MQHLGWVQTSHGGHPMHWDCARQCYEWMGKETSSMLDFHKLGEKGAGETWQQLLFIF